MLILTSHSGRVGEYYASLTDGRFERRQLLPFRARQDERAGNGTAWALTVLFVALKLTGYIDWSWWWVTAPLWGGAAVLASLALIGFGVWKLYRKYLAKRGRPRWRGRRGY